MYSALGTTEPRPCLGGSGDGELQRSPHLFSPRKNLRSGRADLAEKVSPYREKGSPQVSQQYKSDNNAEQTEYHSQAISMSNIPLLGTSADKCELQTKLPAKSTARLVHIPHSHTHTPHPPPQALGPTAPRFRWRSLFTPRLVFKWK